MIVHLNVKDFTFLYKLNKHLFYLWRSESTGSKREVGRSSPGRKQEVLIESLKVLCVENYQQNSLRLELHINVFGRKSRRTSFLNTWINKLQSAVDWQSLRVQILTHFTQRYLYMSVLGSVSLYHWFIPKYCRVFSFKELHVCVLVLHPLLALRFKMQKSLLAVQTSSRGGGEICESCSSHFLPSASKWIGVSFSILSSLPQ